MKKAVAARKDHSKCFGDVKRRIVCQIRVCAGQAQNRLAGIDIHGSQSVR